MIDLTMSRAVPREGGKMSEHYEANGSYVFRGNDCVAICDTDNGTQAEYEARAKLFAAAPELLRLLKAGVDLEAGELTGAEWTSAIRSWMAEARAAIARAKGEK